MRSTMPRAFQVAADGAATVNTDFFSNVKLTSTHPQVVTYTINPKAGWSDGAPITWEDIQSQINATSGKDKGFAIAATNGSDRVEKVERGVDDREAVVTFAKPWSDWRGMFAGSTVLLPKSSTSSPEAFNKAQLNGPGPSAGPFIVSNLDRGAKRITLTRNPKWWGTPPLLDSITYLVLDDAARIPALQNNTIDATGLATLDEMLTARSTQDISVRRAPGLSWYHFTFNGAPGSILEDPALRRAIAKGIDRKTIAEVTQRGLADKPVPLNNHIYVAGQEGYQDNSGAVAFDPEKAKQELDALGWRQGGQFREKDGRQLVIRDVLFDSLGTRQYGQIAQNNLAQIGVKLDLDVRPAAGFFTDFVTVGNFDITQFSWSGDAFPLASLTQIYRTNAESNFGKISRPQIDAKIEQTVGELDPVKARALANELDKMLFDEVFSLPLTQNTGNIAVRSNLANFGAFGLADPDYTTIGFMKR
jgi:peptide/nickel transport system substrate-binding protein